MTGTWAGTFATAAAVAGVVLALAAATPASSAPAAAPITQAKGGPSAKGKDERETPSGYPVPRYISLKFAKVNARAGPGPDHRLKFVYRQKGLPLQVVAETSEWRRVCDPEGQVSWVHKRGTEGRARVINMGAQPAPLYRTVKPGAPVVAYLNTRALADLDRCEKGFCRIKPAGAPAGWVREGALWGTSEALQCR